MNAWDREVALQGDPRAIPRSWIAKATQDIFDDANKRVTATAPIRDGVIVFGEDFNYTLRYLKRSRLSRLRRFLLR